jgi:hypothetical protein
MNPSTQHPFPIFASQEEAEAYSNRTGDAYFQICYWLEGRLNLCEQEMHEIYVNQPPAKRRLQTGRLRQMICREELGMATLPAILKCCRRYATEETCHAHTVRDACTLLEWELHFRALPYDLENPDRNPPDAKQTSLVLGRLCDWLESRIHEMTHRASYLCPDMFSPNADIAHLASLGFVQRKLAKLPARDKERFHGLLDRGAEKYEGTKLWPRVGKAMHDPQPGKWRHPKVDEIVISLWPLVLRHNWTYADLLKVLDRLLPAASHNEDREYPLDCEDSLKMHCRSTCGLTKNKKGKSAEGMPEGWPIAEKLFAGRGK